MTRGTTTTRAAQKAATRRKILDVARAHLERDGFDGASFRAVAEDAGVAVGTVVLHFGDKKGLLHAALYDDLEDAIGVCLSRGSGGSLLERLTDTFAPAYAYYERRPALSRTLLESSLFAASPWRERFAGQALRVHARLGALVEEARGRGEIARDADAVVLAASIFSFYYMALIGWAQGQVDAPLPMFAAMADQHLRGVLHAS
jgi:AcrR family transcriptional regulator